MSQFIDGPTRQFTSNGAIAQYLRVVLSSGVLAAAGATVPCIGTAEDPILAADTTGTVRLRNAGGTRKMVASSAITLGNPVYASASGRVASTGTVMEGIALEAAAANGDVIEVLMVEMPGLGPVPRVFRGRFTIAEVNAGATVLAAVPGYRYRLQDAALIAVGGNVGAATGILLRATQSASAVTLMDAKTAGLTRSTLLRAGTATNGLILADGASFVANDANTAITIIKDGSDITTATHIDVLLTYELVAA
jgi:hypothetical protein